VTVATHGSVGLAAVWRLLSLGFTAPAEQTLAEVETLADALMHASPERELFAISQAVRTATPDVHSTQFAALFQGSVRVPPYEGSYELDPIRQGRQMADVAAFYRAFGADTHGPVAERPDFVGCELEFLSFLELRRLRALEAGEDGVEVLDDVRDSFLADHAGRWLPTFFASVSEESPPGSLYAALAELGARVLAEELSCRGIEPPPLPRRASWPAVEADVLGCGADTGSPRPGPGPGDASPATRDQVPAR
jgi:TorA maturation chaperone TorD